MANGKSGFDDFQMNAMEAMATDGAGPDSGAAGFAEKGAAIAQGDSEGDPSINYLAGWRLHAMTLGLPLGLFLVNFEITIVSTALVNIIDDLQEFKRSSWILTAYLITYVAGIVIWAKLSDLLGRKPTCIAALLIFAAFSGGCGAAQNLVQLVVCRAFQGIGGSGIYAVDMAMLYELVPPVRYPLYMATVTAVVALAFALGPVLGGIISTWRWVFLFNVPAALAAAAILLLAVPSGFPRHGQSMLFPTERRSSLLKLRRIDFLGGFLMLAAMALQITGMEEAASRLDWSGATVLGPLIASAVVWAAFFANSWRATRRQDTGRSAVEPVLPWRFVMSRPVAGLLLTSFMIGAVSITCIFQLPLRYQTSAGLNALQAGVRMIPLAICGPIGTIVCAVLCKGERLPPLYLAIAGSVLQILAVGAAAPVQLRYLSSSTVIPIINAVGNTKLRNELLGILPPEQILAIFRSSEVIKTLPSAELQRTVRSHFVESFNLEMHIVLGFAVVGVFTALLMWQRNQVRVP
ncbi:ba547b17-0231-4f79-90ca-c1e314706002 [Thermothielavioides terrestris]|uniref:Ba547b17-0231-4f79-90ca-c1e314706002 n=1 Tax=Thermothielavioides terrestris TaxID=2587410 RepID=A0A446BUJ4_9PEZI|nr:ba547b17-0231-4f79-90ca-c1e314706002 [Thermothielavioides terrestris]